MVEIWLLKKYRSIREIGIDTCLSLTNAADGYMLVGGAKGKVYYLNLESSDKKKKVQCVSFEDKASKQADKENVSHGPINSIYAFQS